MSCQQPGGTPSYLLTAHKRVVHFEMFGLGMPYKSLNFIKSCWSWLHQELQDK